MQQPTHASCARSQPASATCAQLLAGTPYHQHWDYILIATRGCTGCAGCVCVLQVVMYDCFRPGDVVRAKVLSLGDARSYYLTTADNSLGVVHAKSLAGV